MRIVDRMKLKTGQGRARMDRRAAVLSLLLAAAAAPALARAEPPAIASDRPETQPRAGSVAMALTAPAFRPDAPIPQTYAFDGKNISPALAWSAAPAGSKGFVLIVQDPDSENPRPATHWLAYDIPANVKSLNRGVRNIDAPTTPLGMLQGWNYHGSVGYTGPRPPIGDPPHHYHFQIFALDRRLGLKPGAKLDDVLRAMRGHVIARGELVGTYAIPAPKPEPAAK